jgi:hypothetical protein
MPKYTDRPRIRKTPNCRHLYAATLKGFAVYGWGNTPAEARTKLIELIANTGATKAVGRYTWPDNRSDTSCRDTQNTTSGGGDEEPHEKAKAPA